MAEVAPDSGLSNSDGLFTPWRIAAIALAVLIGAFALYWFVLRSSYDPVLTAVPPQDAADIVKVLDAKKIEYRLADQGTTIQVPSDQADKARIELVGSELPMRGQVGFELFNQSDMGLTEFAQKINYQRALQGELARTLLMLDGIQSVRVHLGLAERSLFRDEQRSPKASVALVLKPGTTLTEGRVSGIQRLVAGAVPDLVPEAVAVLDETGKIVSRGETLAAAPLSANEARLLVYRTAISDALRRSRPDLRFGLVVSLQIQSRPSGAGNRVTPGEPTDARDAIKVAVTTPSLLDEATQRDVSATIRQSIGTEVREVAITFLVGEPTLAQPGSLSTGVAVPSDRVVSMSTRELARAAGDSLPSPWWLLIPIALAALGFAIWSDRRRQAHRNQGLVSFAEQLRERLAGLPEAAA